jgi:uncharacterized phage-associated protein
MNTTGSITLAKYVLAKLGQMPHLKLQKLLYYIEAWHLAILDCELIPDKFEAWMHGPVLRNIWYHYRDYGMMTLNNLVYIDEHEKNTVEKIMEQYLVQDQIELINDVLNEYGDKSAYHLECLTHSERPWVEARKEIEPAEKCSNEISKKTMKEYYSKLLYQQ